jgi:hypothetical protein
MNNQEKPALMERVEQLILEFSGREWKKISQRLLQEGYGEIGTNLLRKKFARWEFKRGQKQPEQNLLQEPGTDQLEGMAAMTELIAKRIFNQPVPEQWIDQIEDHVEDMLKPVIQRVAQDAAIEALRSISPSRPDSVGALEEPPEPERVPGTRKENREWERVSATVDSNLMKLFNLERKQRRMSTSRLLETILWLHFNKPRLSYEESKRTDDVE